MASLLEAITTTAKAVKDTIDKKKKESEASNTETTSSGNKTSSDTATARTASEAAASGDFDTPFNGKKRSSGGTGTTLSSYGVGTSTNYGTYQDDLKRLSDAQKKYQVEQLKAAQTKALANLDEQEQEIKPYYQNARNQVTAQSMQGARNFAEYLANRGLTNSGAAAQAEINRTSQLNNNLGNINQAEANAYRDIANQRTQVNNDYVSGLAAANAGIQQDYYNNLLNYNEQQRQLVNNLKQQALGQYAGDYQAYMNTLDPNSMEYLYAAAARGNKVANANSNAYTYQNALNNIANGNWSYNDLVATGMSNDQATKYYTDTQAAKQAAANATAEQLAYDRQQDQIKNEIDLQKLANATAETQYKINEPYNTTVYHVSSGGNNNTKLAPIDYLDYMRPYLTQDEYIDLAKRLNLVEKE